MKPSIEIDIITTILRIEAPASVDSAGLLLYEPGLQRGEERLGKPLEVGRGQADPVPDLELHDGLASDILDDIVRLQDSPIVDERVGDHLDLVERVAVLAGQRPQTVDVI